MKVFDVYFIITATRKCFLICSVLFAHSLMDVLEFVRECSWISVQLLCASGTFGKSGHTGVRLFRMRMSTSAFIIIIESLMMGIRETGKFYHVACWSMLHMCIRKQQQLETFPIYFCRVAELCSVSIKYGIESHVLRLAEIFKEKNFIYKNNFKIPV